MRTVLGDIPAGDLGVCYAHEHLIIDGGRPVELFPDFLLDDVDRAVRELAPAVQLGLRGAVDAMPYDAGRNVAKLAEISRRSGVHIVTATGLHHERYYDDGHWVRRADVEALAALFTREVAEGTQDDPAGDPDGASLGPRAGVVKVAGSHGELTDHDRRVFAAAAEAHRATGCPVLTHCEKGTAGVEQIAFLADAGVPPARVVLSHTDRIVDRGYHREILATGAFVEYDQSFRWSEDVENGTLTLLEWAFGEDFGDQVMLGMDAARQGYWATHGGKPGMAFLLGDFAAAMAARGIGPAEQDRLFVRNPARAFAFAPSGASR